MLKSLLNSQLHAVVGVNFKMKRGTTGRGMGVRLQQIPHWAACCCGSMMMLFSDGQMRLLAGTDIITKLNAKGTQAHRARMQMISGMRPVRWIHPQT